MKKLEMEINLPGKKPLKLSGVPAGSAIEVAAQMASQGVYAKLFVSPKANDEEKGEK